MGILENGLLKDPDNIRDFVFGGHAEFTLHSLKTDKHFTYQIIDNWEEPTHPLKFVFFLAGSNNENDWSYLGSIRRFANTPDKKASFLLTKKSPSKETLVIKAFEWFIRQLNKNTIDGDQLEFMHSGKCSACGRKLTTPESIRTGLGPVCRSNYEYL